MSVFSMAGSNPALPTYPLQRSVRLRSSASAYFSRTPAVAGNRKTWTWSGWVKRGTLGVLQSVFVCGPSTGLTDTNYFGCGFNSTDTFGIGGGATSWRVSNAIYRDPSAWYHIVIAVDTTQATGANRIRAYVNGVELTWGTSSDPTLNADLGINQNISHSLGSSQPALTRYVDGYLEEINFIDGQALTPSSFGAYNSYGVWSPAKYTGSYGTNGFYLNFQDNSALTTTANVGIGKDSSGNGNYWTSNNISLTAGVTYDSMVDVPTNTSPTNANFPTLNPVDNTGVTITNGNLTATTPGTNQACKATMSLPTTGKWYFEVTDVVTGGTNAVGIANVILPTNTSLYLGTGTIYVGMSSNAVFGFAFNFDALTYTIYKNNSVDSSGSITSGITYIPFMQTSSVGGASTAFNFGQRPFSYTPPTGFNRLNTYNLPDSIVPVGAQYMAATTYTGNGTTQSITNTVNGFSLQPDFVWYKGRSQATGNALFDSVRGALQYLASESTSAESTLAGSLTSFNSSGFSIGNQAGTNANTQTYVGWQWRASNASAVTNTAGTITSSVSANQTAGFSIVTYTGTGSAATVGHGLGAAPNFIIIKSRSNAVNWFVGGSNVASAGGGTWASVMEGLNTTAAVNTGATAVFNSTAPTSSVFTLGTEPNANGSGRTFVAYCFAAVPGYSAFGRYTGNGSTDGPFIYTGFRPRWIMIKQTNAAGFDWFITDTSRDPYNVASKFLVANTSAAEVTTAYIDLLSNGFKLRYSGGGVNVSAATYIYAVFAENPFKNSLAR